MLYFVRVERCPFCGSQLAACDCIKTVLKLNDEEAEAIDEFANDWVEPVKSIMERWREALGAKGVCRGIDDSEFSELG